ncbi:MAG: hypothetical protein HGA85_00585 [Nanoarchaeota archaeon]|nr:hypothetical protein [Nanoarchaeota archaeon]
MVKANVDMILDVLRQKKSVSVGDLSRQLTLPKDDIMKSAEYLEEDGVIKIENKFPNTFLTFVKEPDIASSGVPLPMPPRPQPAQRPDLPAKPQGPSTAIGPPPMPPQNFQQPQLGQGLPPPPQSGQQGLPPPPVQAATVNIYTQQPISSQPMQQQTAPRFQESAPSQFPGNTFSASPMQQQNQIQSSQFSGSDSNIFRPAGQQQDKNPLDDGVTFDMAVPLPGSSPTMVVDQSATSPTSTFSTDTSSLLSQTKDFMYPSYVQTEMEKLDFHIDELNKKITNHEYKNMNVAYRDLYMMFHGSTGLSPNERYLVGEKINELFMRIKRIYLIEGVMA